MTVSSLTLAQLVFYSSVFIVTSSLTNPNVTQLNTKESNLLIDKRFGRVDSLNSTTSVGEGKASLIIHPKKQFWVEQIARKLAPFFSVISFWNEKCWTAGYDQGTCYSSKECVAKRGKPSGMCAAGFGVCCVFSYSCDSATHFNRTYFLSPKFPDTSYEFGVCSHSILKLDDICQIRLDFEILELERPNKHGFCEHDSLTIHGTDFHMPPLCGDLTGHHLYLPVGYDPKITMQVSLLSGNPWGRWKIRTTKIKCSSNMLAPPGCQQHHYGTAGRITSFNYYQGEESNMNNLNYGVCVRKERGFCAIQWTLCNQEERKKRSVGDSGVTQRRDEMPRPDLNEISIANTLKTRTHIKDSGLAMSRSYAGVHVSRPRPYGSDGEVRCQDQIGGSLQNSSFYHMISCPPEKEAINRKYLYPPTDVWRPFIPGTNYYVQTEKPTNPVKLERRTLDVQIGSEQDSHTWTNSITREKSQDLSHQVKDQEPISLSLSPGMKNPTQVLPIRKYMLQEQPLQAAGSESTFTFYSNPIPNGNQVHHNHYNLRDSRPYVKSGKDPHLDGIGEKVLGIKIPFYTSSKHVSASGGVQAGAQVNVDHKPGTGHGSWNKPPINVNPNPIGLPNPGYIPPIHNSHKPIHSISTGDLPPIHTKPKPAGIPGGGGVPPIHIQPKPTFGGGLGGAGGVLPVHAKPKPAFVGGVGGAGGILPVLAKPKPTFAGGVGGALPIAVKPKPVIGAGGFGSLLNPSKIKVKPKPKPLVNNGFGLFGRPKVKPKPILPFKPWGHKDKNKGNGTCKPKVIVVPVPIPLPIPIPIPIVPVVVVPFPFGGGGGGGGGGGHGDHGHGDHGHGDHGHDDKHKVISITEPYIIRIVTDDEREDGLSSFCMDWEQIPCDIWWTHHPKFPDHNEL